MKPVVLLTGLAMSMAWLPYATAAPIALTLDAASSSFSFSHSMTIEQESWSVSDSTSLAGAIDIDVDHSLPGVPSALRFASANVVATSGIDVPLTVNFMTPSGTLVLASGASIFQLALDLSTPGVPPGSKPPVTGGAIDLNNDHLLQISDAVINPFTILEIFVELDFPEDEESHQYLPVSELPGTATITETPLGGNDFLVTLTVDFLHHELVQGTIEGFTAEAERTISGTIVATGVHTVPEPSGIALLLLGACLVLPWVRHARR